MLQPQSNLGVTLLRVFGQLESHLWLPSLSVNVAVDFKQPLGLVWQKKSKGTF